MLAHLKWIFFDDGDYVLMETVENVSTYCPGYSTENFTTDTVFDLKDKAQNKIS